MSDSRRFQILTIGWEHTLVTGLSDRIAARGRQQFSHLVHPSYTRHDWPDQPLPRGVHVFRESPREALPPPDRELLASLERDGVPTIHNMIISDRVVSELDYDEALRYATFLARRLRELFLEIRPDVVLASFDALHAGISLGVARMMGIPWFALHFNGIPEGLTGFCDGMCPAATVPLRAHSAAELRALAESSLQKFEHRKIQPSAHVAPRHAHLGAVLAAIPGRVRGVMRVVRKSRMREFLRFTEPRSAHSVRGALEHIVRARAARRALSKVPVVHAPPSTPYVFFGLHMQPESSIDVWAPFFSNQMWVIELLARSVPPSHKLLVKIHKSDTSNYSRRQLEHMRSFPSVELVDPFADTRQFIQKAELIVSIQGTMGLEGALLGKPVIMLGDSPYLLFPSVSRIGEIADLPQLIGRKLAEKAPERSDILRAYAFYLTPFMSASANDWTQRPSEEAIGGYVELFSALQQYVAATGEGLQRASS